jgi:hypothetical protein
VETTVSIALGAWPAIVIGIQWILVEFAKVPALAAPMPGRAEDHIARHIDEEIGRVP